MWYPPFRLRDMPGMILSNILDDRRDAKRKRSAWRNDQLQFTRLLAELNGVGLTEMQYSELADSMNLDVEDIDELLARADAAWERIKEERAR